MPATPKEIDMLKNIIKQELPEVSLERLQKLTKRLDEESGQPSTNDSYKKTLKDLRLIYERPKTVKTVLWGTKIGLGIKTVFHFWLVLTNLIGFFFLPIATIYQKSWTLLFISCICCTYTFNLFTTNMPCGLTKLENNIRRFLGLPEISTFCAHYIIKPSKKLIDGLKKRV